MKKNLLFFAILMSSLAVKAQYPSPYRYNYSYTEIITQYEDLGPYGYQNLIIHIQRYGYISSPYSTSISENKFMDLPGYNGYVNVVGTLRKYPYAGTTLTYNYYINGIWIGSASVVGRRVTRSLYRSKIYQARSIINLRRY